MVKEGFLDIDIDDYKKGSFMAELEKQVQAASHRVVVRNA